MASLPSPPYRNIEWDDDLEKTPLAVEITTRGYLRVELWLRANAPSRILDLDIVIGIHRTIFEGLFPDFAGVLRGPDLPYDSVFGNYRGASYLCVLDECQKLFNTVGDAIHQLDQLCSVLPPQDFDEQTLRIASYAHCELIRIHPFVNGNGRTARACINYLAWRYGMVPIAITRSKGEYIEPNRTWLQQGVIDHMMDFLRPRWTRA